MSMPNFVKEFVDRLEKNEVNREFKGVTSLDIVRIDARYENFNDVKKSIPQIKVCANKFISRKELLSVLSKVEDEIKSFKKEVKQNE